jgi:hypothetical protein
MGSDDDEGRPFDGEVRNVRGGVGTPGRADRAVGDHGEEGDGGTGSSRAAARTCREGGGQATPRTTGVGDGTLQSWAKLQERCSTGGGAKS